MFLLALALAICGCSVPADPAPKSADAADDPPPSASDDAPWTVYRPAQRDPRWAGVVCNDGSPTSVALRKSATGSNDWVVMVAGGYYCDEDKLPCSDRAPRYTTALSERGAPIPDGGTWNGMKGGLFSRDASQNPTFADANHAMLWYCTSDLWLGPRSDPQPNTASAAGWVFDGRAALRAGLELLGTQGMDPADPATRILLVGQSSGGIGLAANLDTVTGTLGPAVGTPRLQVLIDGGWVPPVEPGVAGTLNAWGPLLGACEDDRRAAGVNPQECLSGPAWYPYWKARGIPLLVAQSGLDTTQLGMLKIHDAAGRGAWRDQVRDSLQGVDNVFSGGARYHVIAFDPKVARSPMGRQFHETVGRFWAGGGPEQVFTRYDEVP